MNSSVFSARLARIIFLLISAVALIYHGLILTGVVDYRYAWGGRLPDRQTMFRMESVSVSLQVAFMVLVGTSGRAKSRTSKRTVGIILVGMGILFLFNTVGNLLAVTAFEKYAFTPLTLIAALCCFRLAAPMFEKTQG